MPIYEYCCSDCGADFEAWQKITATGAECEACGSANTTRKISMSSFVLKGSGWYVTDYGKKGQSQSESSGSKNGSSESKSSEPSTAESKPEAKPESKPEAPAPAKSDTPAKTSST